MVKRFVLISQNDKWAKAGRLLLALTLLNAVPGVLAQICALPGNDGISSIAGIVNTYWQPNTTNATYNSGSTSIPLIGKAGATPNIAPGDLVLIIQMQCANINTTNTNAYGDGVSETGDGTATGFTDPSGSCLAGRYEFVRAGPGSNATTLDLTGSPLQHTYVQAVATNTTGRRTFQIVRVPQYWDATLSAAVTAAPWNGFTGGLVVLDVGRTLNLNGQSINVDGLGFRGGGGRNRSANDATIRYRWDGDTRHASKGEGIAGTPRYVSNKTSPDNGNTATITDNGATWGGYPTGSATTGDFARGAPGNAGGGGTDWSASSDNGGGGGGGNGNPGGRGGAGWRNAGYSGILADYSNLPDKKWGFGGSSFPASVSRIVLGGGGGAGANNNNSQDIQSSGASGGGIILLRATTLVGSGTLSARGARAPDNPLNDGAGGGGAGGTVIALAKNWTTGTVTINVQGGRGGDSFLTGTVAHGAGGGGSGGVVLRSGAATVNLAGGNPGNTNTGDSPPGGARHGAQSGGTGVNSLITIAADTPGSNAGYNCVFDYGDAPDTGTGTATGNYQTTRADNGPRHRLTSGLYMGSANVDVDSGILQNATAMADDADGNDDEDGVSSFPLLLAVPGQSYNVSVSVTNVTGTTAYLVGYIDFNRDGDFLDVGERSSTVTVSSGTSTLTVPFTTPLGISAGTTYARFRLSLNQSEVESSVGLANSGEVEDYMLTMSALTCPSGYAPTVGSGNALVVTSSVSVINPNNALGALTAAGSTATTVNSAQLTSTTGATLILDLGQLIPEGAVLTISLARANNAGAVSIDTSPNNISYAGAVTFNSGPNNTLSYLSYTVPTGSGGVRYVRFARTSGAVWVDGVSYTSYCSLLENPVIGAAKQLEHILPLSSSPTSHDYTLVYRLTVENFGNVALSNLAVFDDVVTQFSGLSPRDYNVWVNADLASPTPLLSPAPTLTLSASWNGSASSNILTSGQSLMVSESKHVYISFMVTVNPSVAAPNNRLRDNTVIAQGTSPGSTLVTDTSTNGLDPDPNGDDDPSEDEVTSVSYVKLIKEVRNCGNSLSSCSGSYVTSEIGEPGDYLEYRIRFHNISSYKIGDLEVSDSLVATTPFQEDTYGVTDDFSLQCPDGSVVTLDRADAAVDTTPGVGPITAFEVDVMASSACNLGSVSSGESGHVLFKVLIP